MVKGIALLILIVAASLVEARELQKIAFGSCNNQYHAQPLWKDMILEKPDLFIWAGDNIYANTKDPARIKSAYDRQNAHPEYKFFKSTTPVIGTWDDHDFAFNNATGIFSKKTESQTHFLNFIGEPMESPRRQQNGIYTSYEYGKGEKKIKVILLDVRYFKDLDPGAPLLGEEQWKWFEGQLRDSTASLHFIVSGLSVFSPRIPVSEEYADHPGELNRFKKILNAYKSKRPVILSGDKHFASIFKRHGHLEFMSSGMTHTLPVGVRKVAGSGLPNAFYGLNYGLIDIAWEKGAPILTMAVRNRNGENIFRKIFYWKNQNWEE